MNSEAVKKIEDYFNSRKKITEVLFSRSKSLSSLLPYDEYLEKENMFVLKDGSLGAIFEAKLEEHEPLTEDQVLKKVNSLNRWFILEENCVLQVHYEQSEISKHDQKIKSLENSYPNSHPVSKMQFDSKLDKLKENCGKSNYFSPFERKTYLSLRYFPGRKNATKSKFRDQDGEFLYNSMSGFVKNLNDFKGKLIELESNSLIELKRVDASDLLSILRKFFNPETYYKRSFAPFNKNLSLSNQFLYNSPVLDHEGIEREGIKTRTISLKTSPQYAYPGGIAYFTSLDFPFKISLNFSFPSKAKVKRFFDFKEFFLQNTPTAKAKIQKEEVLSVQDRLARDDRCLHLTFNVIIEGETEEILDQRTQRICSIFQNQLESEVIVEKDIGLGLCINSLPLCYTPDSDYSSQRYIRILRSVAVNFLPVFDSFRGTKNPVALFLSRENNLVPFSLLENQTSNHTCILADTGSGKSSFVIDWIQSAKRMSPEPLIFIIDKKSSYTMLSEFYDGDLTIFDRNMEVPFSPFRGNYDEEKIAFLTKLICSAISLSSPSFQIESEHQAAISKAIKLAYIKKKNRMGLTYIEGELLKQKTDDEIEITMDDVVIELGGLNDPKNPSFREIITSITGKLKPFYGDGIYAKFFKTNHRSQGKSKLFFAYDLDALDSDPILQTLMTMAIFEEIRRIIKLPENQGRTGFLIMEEFAMLGRKNPLFKDIAIDFAETMRKLGCWIIALTPRPQNYFDLEVGKAFWSVADNYIFLQMNDDNVEFIRKNSSLLDEASAEIIKSLKTINGKHAEVFYMNKKKEVQGAFKNFQTPFIRWMSPTNALDAREADRALKKFSNKWEALEYLVNTFPEGVKAIN